MPEDRTGRDVRLAGSSVARQTRLMKIRARQESDFAALGAVTLRVHESDQYPILLPNGDVERFLRRPDSTAAWVATDDDSIVGHVALNAETWRWSCASRTRTTGGNRFGVSTGPRCR